MTIYVSNTGSDANDGSSDANAVATIARADALWTAGGNLRQGSVLFRRGHTWGDGVNLSQWEIGQGSAAATASIIGAYGDEADPKPLFDYVSIFNSGSGLYDCTISDLHLRGVFGTDTRGINLTNIVGASTVTVQRVTSTDWRNGIRAVQFNNTKEATIQLLDSEIIDNWSIGVNYSHCGVVSVRNTIVQGNAFGNTQGVRTHNKFTHGMYASNCARAIVTDSQVIDNGSYNIKISSDSINGSVDTIVANNLISDGFSSIALNPSDVPEYLGGFKHRNAKILNNRFVRTRHAGTSRRVDATTQGSASRDYWDHLIEVDNITGLYCSGNSLTWEGVTEEADCDAAASFANHLIGFTSLPSRNCTFAGNSLGPCPAIYSYSGTLQRVPRRFLFSGMAFQAESD